MTIFSYITEIMTTTNVKTDYQPVLTPPTEKPVCNHRTCTHIQLISTQGDCPKNFIVDYRILMASPVLWKMVQDSPELRPLEVFEVKYDAKTVESILLYLKHLETDKEDYKKFMTRMNNCCLNLFECSILGRRTEIQTLILAANQLGIERLLHIACTAFAMGFKPHNSKLDSACNDVCEIPWSHSIEHDD